MATKHCSRCCQVKPHSEFHKHSRSLDGLQYWCKSCIRQANTEYELKNKDRLKQLRIEWRKNNKERDRENAKRWRANNPEKAKAQYARADELRDGERRAQWLIAYRPVRRSVSANWRNRNPGKCRAIESRKRAVKLQAIPPWADYGAISAIYKEANSKKLSVDHIVPLNSSIVCGLHVHTNLQLLPLIENIKKGNRIWPDMP